jgi:hypothetical protein
MTHLRNFDRNLQTDQPGDVIVVRLCARYLGRHLVAQTGYLKFELGDRGTSLLFRTHRVND